MIGDHLQLRPKTENYDLRKQANKGHAFNVSLFERLARAAEAKAAVAAGYAVRTGASGSLPVDVINSSPNVRQLTQQHRMHPSVSAIARAVTYPGLLDAPSVGTRPNLRGVAANVVFLSHSYPEIDEADAVADVSTSKVNQHEVDMCVALVKYFLQQGYDPGSLVVLTMYLGQLKAVSEALLAVQLGGRGASGGGDGAGSGGGGGVGVFVADRDVAELKQGNVDLDGRVEGSKGAPKDAASNRRAGGGGRGGAGGGTGGGGTGSSSSSAAPKQLIRVATVDNFQGEEADVVILTTVRSNALRKVGHVGEPERVNVAMTRARIGMVILGDSDMLQNATPAAAAQLWKRVLGQFEDDGAGGAAEMLARLSGVEASSSSSSSALSPVPRPQRLLCRGFPARCLRHGTIPEAPLETAADFVNHCPDGGCKLSCGVPLPSCPHGHTCPRRCHPYDGDPGSSDSHAGVVCMEKTEAKCERGLHRVQKGCGQGLPPCRALVSIPCAAGLHTVERSCHGKRVPECRKMVEDRCEGGHFRERRCCEASLRSCRSCDKVEAAERRQRQAALAAARARSVGVEEAKGVAATAQMGMRGAQGELRDATLRMRAAEEARLATRQEKRVRGELKKLEAQHKKLKMMQEVEEEEEEEEEGKEEEEEEVGEGEKEELMEEEGGETEEGGGVAGGEGGDNKDEAGAMRTWGGALTEARTHGVDTTGAGASAGDGASAGASPTGGAGDATSGAASSTSAATPTSTPTKKKVGSRKPDAGSSSALDPGVVNALQLMDGEEEDREWLRAYDVLQAVLVQQKQQQGGGGGKSGRVGAEALLLLVELYLGEPAVELRDRLLKLQGDVGLCGSQQSLMRVPPHKAIVAFVGALLNHKLGDVPATVHEHARLFLRCAPGLSCPCWWVDEASRVLEETAIGPPTPGGGGSRSSTGVGAASVSLSRADAIAGKWARQLAKDQGARRVDSIKKVMELTGLAEVKEMLVAGYHHTVLMKEQGTIGSGSYNARFDGNPGTGKTTVARLYAQFLRETEVLPKTATFEETSGAKLTSGGVEELKKLLENVKKAKGGVVFVDEAYQLNPGEDRTGRQVLDFILPIAERLDGSEYGPVVWVFAGYDQQMDKLFEHNVGLPSRFPCHYRFKDYSNEELLCIFEGMRAAKSPVFKLEADKHATIAMARLGRMSGTPGFGNARAVRNLYDLARKRQAARIMEERESGGKPDIFLLARSDVLGPRPDRRLLESNPSVQELMSMEGLEQVKRSVNQLLELVIQNAEREEAEKPLVDVSLNRVFLGNPGTGKTTVARIYGKILRDFGLLSKGDVLLRNPSDFVGSVVGSSEQQTRAILKSAEGCVLVIDEAYSLFPSASTTDPFRVAVIDTLVEQVQAVPGDDRAVILLGYRAEMERMLADANPGLSRRFQLENAFEFADYEDAALLRILRSKAKKDGLPLDMATARAAVKQLERARAMPNFGNAGAVVNLLTEAKLRMQTRLAAARKQRACRVEDKLTVADFVRPGDEDGDGDEETIFADLLGCGAVLEKLREYRDAVNWAKDLGRDPKGAVAFNFLFVGSPGTGKTTVARRMGRLFKSLGLLPTSDVVEISASDLTTGYAGQAGKKTSDVMLKARGKVLFIDEAYQLNPMKGGGYMQEVVDELVRSLTSEQLIGQIVVILAGYEADMEEMLGVNAGLSSRFSETIKFPDLGAGDAAKMLVSKLKSKSLLVEELGGENERGSTGTMKEAGGTGGGERADTSLLGALTDLAAELIAAGKWGNGREVETWSKECIRQLARRSQEQRQAGRSAAGGRGGGQINPRVVTLADAKASVDLMLKRKLSQDTSVLASSSGGASAQTRILQQQQQQQKNALPPPPPPILRVETAQKVECSQGVEIEELEDGWEEVEGGEKPAAPPGVDVTNLPPNAFAPMDPTVLSKLQDVLDAEGWNTEDEVRRLLRLPVESVDWQTLVGRLVSATGMARSDAVLRLREWKEAADRAYAQAEAEAKAQAEAIAAKQRVQVAIYRCRVCGRADKPYIVCYVAPYICRYITMDAKSAAAVTSRRGGMF